MSTSQLQIIVTFIPFIIGAIVFVPLARKNARKANGTEAAHKRQVVRNQYLFLYNNVFTRKAFRHIVTSFASLMCYDYEQLQEACVKLFTKAVTVAVAMPVYMFLTSKDLFITGLAALVGLVYYDASINIEVDKQIRSMSDDISYTIQSISDGYSLIHDIPRAVQQCERASCLEKPIIKIHEMLLEENGRVALKDFKKSTPVRLLSTLATTCYISNEEGDEVDETGEYKFVKKMTQMRIEADSKVQHLLATEIAFKSLQGMTLVGLAVTPLFDMFLLKWMPGTSAYLRGVYGYIEKSCLLILTVICYYLISVLRRPSVVNTVDKIEFIDRISHMKPVRKFIKSIIPRSYKAKVQWKSLLDGAISSKNLEYIYTLKIIAGGLAVIVATAMMVAYTINAKVNMWNNYKSLSATKGVTEMTEDMYRQLKRMDKDYMTRDEKMEDEDAVAFVKASIPGLSSLEVQQQVDRLSLKWDKYRNIKFHWWYWIIIYGIGCIGWFCPEVSLLIRKELVKYEAAEDVMQLQSLMMTLQATKMDVFQCLYWMKEEATVHKGPLTFAHLEYPSDPELALRRLKDSVGLKDMKRIISKLEKSIYDSSVEDAFRDIVLDKQQSLVVNQMLQAKTLVSKKEYARMLASTPLNIALYCGFMVPMFILGMQQLMSAFGKMGSI